MKKIILSAIATLTLSSSLFAVDNINDIKPLSYGQNNITVNFLLGSQYEEQNSQTLVDPGSTFGVGIHSKASLKEIHYKVADIYWEGGGEYSYQKYKNNDEIQNLYFDLDLGVASHVSNLLYSANAGVAWTWKNTTYALENIPATGETDDTYSKMSVFGEGTLAYDFGKYSLGTTYRVSMYNEEGSFHLIHKIKLPLQYNVDRFTAVTLTPSYEYDIDTDHKKYWFTFGFSWLYK